MPARSLLLVSLLSLGCSGGTDLDNPEHVAAWANSASALAVYLPAYEPIGVADGEVSVGDGTCPSVVDDGTTLVITGGCTTGDGRRFEGTATVVRGADGRIDLTLDGYGNADEDDSVPRVTGTFAIVRTSAEAQTFVAQYVQDGLLSLDVDYAGSVEGTYDGATLWNGQGTVARGGFTDASGEAAAVTVDQRRDDDVCRGEAASGTTTIDHADRTLVIEYDGATACDEDHSARYRVDGEDRGTVPGITCAASPCRGGSGLLLLAPLAALMLSIRRRVRR